MIRRLFYFLPYLSILNGINVVVGGLNVRFDQLACVILFVFAIFFSKKALIGKADIPLIILLATGLLSSFLNSPDSKYSMIQSLNLITVSTAFFVVRFYIKDVKQLHLFLASLFNASIIASVGGILLFFLSYLSGFALFGINLTQNESEAFGIYFTMREPNVYGSFMLIVFFVSFSLYLKKTYSFYGFTRRKVLTVLFLSLISILFSFTRATWLAAIIGICIFYFGSLKSAVKHLPKILGSTIVVAFLYMVTVFILKINFLTYKIENFFSTTGGTGEGRLMIWELALENWRTNRHYLIGNGTYSFASFFNINNDLKYNSEQNAWIGNLLITVLHDTGILGLLMFLIFFILLVAKTYIFSLNEQKQYKEFFSLAALNVGLRIAAIGIFIAFFFTLALSYTYPWILFGLITATSKISIAYKFSIRHTIPVSKWDKQKYRFSIQ